MIHLRGESDMLMTPYMVLMLLWYLQSDLEFPDCRDYNDKWNAAVQALKSKDLLELEDATPRRRTYRITERGKVLVQAMLELPLPVQKWTMPGSNE
jgi:hypothetical protein